MSHTLSVVAAHTHSANHRQEIESSTLCGCFYCLSTFKPSAVEEWIDWPEGTPEDLDLSAGTTALCPKCGIDSVIGSSSGYPIDTVFLSAMHRRWFQ